jgi:hypothetical protein
MDWTALSIAIVSHVSWPITIITLAWMFKDSLRSLLGRVESANSKYLKFTLRSHEPFDKLNRGEGIADTLELPSAPDSKRRPTNEFEERLKQVMALASKQPSAALFSAWDLLMQLTGADIERQTGKQPPPDQIIPEAAKIYEQKIVGLMALLLTIVEQQKSNPSAAMEKDFVFRFNKLISRVILSLNRTQVTGELGASDAGTNAGPTIAGDTK